MSFRAASLRVPSFAASLVVTSLLACGCGGGSSSTSGVGGTTGSGAAVPVTLPDGTTVPTVACGDESVSTAWGSWDVVASGTSAAGSANLTIDASSFVVQSSARTLAFRTNGTTMTLQAGESCISLWDTRDGPPTRLTSSTLGLVLLDDDLAMRPTPDRAEIQEAARRLAIALASPDRARASTEHDDLEALAEPRVAIRATPWLTVPASAVVVVPRLSAMAEVAGLTGEIEAAAGAGARMDSCTDSRRSLAKARTSVRDVASPVRPGLRPRS